MAEIDEAAEVEISIPKDADLKFLRKQRKSLQSW